MGMFGQVLADMRERAAVARDAAKNNPDGTVHHEAVADMLEHLAARAEEAHKSEVDFLQGGIKEGAKFSDALGEQLIVLADERARMFSKFPCGVIYQLGIHDEAGEIRNGCCILFTEVDEAAKMPRVGYGDRFYIVPLEQAKIVKGGAE